MARGRMLDKVVILSKKVNAISEGAENLFYRINTCADDYGRYYAEPAILKGQVYTLRKISLKEIVKRMDEIWQIKLIELYQANGEKYLQINEFEKHQIFKADRPKKKEYPAPNEFIMRKLGGNGFQSAPTGIQMDTNGSLSKDKLSKDKIRELSIAQRNQMDSAVPPHRRIKLNLVSRIWEGILDEDRKLWAEAYPACDIEQELKKMIAWAVANPQKAKKSNYAKFITNWLKREQDSGGTKQSFGKKTETVEEYKERQRKALYGE
jgi:hypothetical protein